MTAPITAEIITIGDEILYGQITNTNTRYISQCLSEMGIKTIRHSSVGDTREAILTALAEAAQRAHIVLTTGGLGPTKDDITKQAFAEFFSTDLVEDEQVLAMVRAFFEKRKRPLTPINRAQALVPRNCKALYNPWGTAPAMWFEREGKVFVSMPGVPKEMELLMRERVMPALHEAFVLPVIHHKVIHTIGIGESMLAERIEAWEDALPPHIGLAYLPDFGQVKLRLTGMGDNAALLQAEIEAQAAKVLPMIQEYVFGFDTETLETAIAKLLLEAHATIATAESCTGGYLSHYFTKVAGCSRYFMGGIIAYSNESKVRELGVSPDTLAAHGAVSEPTIIQMAEGVRRVYGTSIGLATSGIAGPDGGTPDKPVGTVWIALADAQGTITKRLQLVLDRQLNIHFTTIAILDMLRKRLKGIANPK